jgi:hypothetical protein
MYFGLFSQYQNRKGVLFLVFDKIVNDIDWRWFLIDAWFKSSILCKWWKLWSDAYEDLAFALS